MIWFKPTMVGSMKKQKENVDILLGRRIRSLRTLKDWTQQELGSRADVNYKFIGEIERGRQNPSLHVLARIAAALEVKLHDLLRFEHEVPDRREIEVKIKNHLPAIPEQDLRTILMILDILYPKDS
jgi:transcriptional regulator with XRE-family HTH domain